MIYSDLFILLEQEFNCDIIPDSHNEKGFVNGIIENCSNNLTYPFACHPDWEVSEIYLQALMENLNLPPHPFS